MIACNVRSCWNYIRDQMSTPADELVSTLAKKKRAIACVVNVVVTYGLVLSLQQGRHHHHVIVEVT